jgi:hypothetical protein
MKRPTKAQKEAAEKAALLQRVLDIYAGATGDTVQPEDYVYADTLQKVMGAVNAIFVGDNEDMKHVVGYWNVDEFGTPSKAADFLYRMGVRA